MIRKPWRIAVCEADLDWGAGAVVYIFNKLLNIFLYSKFNIFYIKKIQIKGQSLLLKKLIIYDLFLIKIKFFGNCKQNTTFQEDS